MPASHLYLRVRYATPGVGMMPAISASAPAEQMPETREASSMPQDIRVSEPTRISGLWLHSPASIWAPAQPSLKASSGVSSLLATPRTPSVPNNLVISVLLQVESSGCPPA